MNKIYKVIFSKVRGKMMVVNETTSSHQQGARKAVTVTATALIGASLFSSALAEPIEIYDDKAGGDHSDCFYEWIRDVYKTQVAFDGFILKEANQQNHNSGDAHLFGNKILQVGSNKGEASKDGGGFEFNNGADFTIGGWGKSVGTADTDSVNDKGLAVLAVNGSKGLIVGNSGDFYGNGYGLISTSKVTIEDRTVQTKLNLYGNSNTGNPDSTGADAAFLVFQNQNNSKDAFYSIENLSNQQITKGIYVDTNNLDFSLTGERGNLKSDTDLQINLGGQDFVQTGGTVSAAGTFYLTGTKDKGEYRVTNGKITAGDLGKLIGGTLRIGEGGSLTTTNYIAGTERTSQDQPSILHIENGGVMQSLQHQIDIAKSELHMVGGDSVSSKLLAKEGIDSATGGNPNNTYEGLIQVKSETEHVKLGGQSFDIKLTTEEGISANKQLELTANSIEGESNSGQISIQDGLLKSATSHVKLSANRGISLSKVTIDAKVQRAASTEALISLMSTGGNISVNESVLDTWVNELTSGQIQINHEGDFGVGIALMRSTLKANDVYIGNGQGKVEIVDTNIWTQGDGYSGDADKGYEFTINAGLDGLNIRNAEIAYNDGDHGTTTLSSKGDIQLEGVKVNDNVSESGKGTLTVKSEQDGASIGLTSTTLDDDTIVLGNGKENITLSEGSVLHPDSDGDGVTVAGKSVTMTGGSHVGTSTDGVSEETGKVNIETETLTLSEASYITTGASQEIAITAPAGKEVAITMDEDSWIKGNKVSVTGTGVGITGGSITTTGGEDSEITVSGGDKGIEIVGPSIDAGKGTVNIGTNNPTDSGNITITGKEPNKGTGITGGNINIGTGIGGGTGVVIIEDTQIGIDPDTTEGKVTIHTGTGTGGKITGTGITGPEVEIGVGTGGVLDISDETHIKGDDIAFTGTGPGEEPGKVIVGGGSTVIAGDEGDDTNTGSGGKIDIGTGIEVVVGQGGSLTSHKGGEPEEGGSINVDGGKLTIDEEGLVEADEDMTIIGGGSVNFVGPDEGKDPGKLVVGGALTVGGDGDGAGQGGSINVGTGDGKNTGIIIAGGSEGPDGNKGPNISVGTGGKVNIGEGDHLIVTDEEKNLPTDPMTGTGITVTGPGTTVDVTGGTLITDKITTDDDSEVVIGDEGYLSIKDPFDEKGDISFDIDEGAENFIVDIGDELTQEEFDKITGIVGDKGTIMTGGELVGGGKTQTAEQWAEDLGVAPNTNIVIKDSGIDISKPGEWSDGTSSGRGQNEIGQGGGSWLVGSSGQDITITGGDQGNGVFITGAQTKDERDGLEVAVDENGDALKIVVDDNNKLTFGNAGSYGGDVSGGVQTGTGSEVGFIGGDWTVGGLTGSGELVIEDKSKHETGTNVTITGEDPVTGSDWSMSGDKTGLTTEGDASFTGKGTLTGGATANIGGGLSVGEGLTLSGSANVTVNDETNITGGMSVEEGTTFNGKGDLTVTGGDSVFGGTVAVGGNYTNTDAKTEITGNTHVTGTTQTQDFAVGEENFAGTGTNGSFTSDGAVSVGGNFTSNTGSNTTVGAGLDVKGESTVGGSVTVGGSANFGGGLHMAEGGSFTNTSDKDGTTVGGHLILDKGSKLDAGSQFELADDQVSIGKDGDGVLNGWIGAGTVDLSKAHTEVVFTGEGSGSNSHQLVTGASGITYENGGTHIFDRIDGADVGGDITGRVNIGVGGSMTMDANKTGSDDKAYLHVNDTLALNGQVTVGDVGSQDTTNPGIYLGKDAVFDLSTEGFKAGDSVLDPAGKIYVSGDADINIGVWTLGTEGTLKVDFDAFDGLNIDELIAEKLSSDSILESFWYDDSKSELGMTLNSASDIEGTDEQVGGVVDAVLGNKGENSRKQELVSEVFSKTSGFMTQDANGNWVVSNRGNQRLEEVLGLPIAAGAFNIAYDAMSQMGNSVGNRMLEADTTKSTSVWADVLATRNSAKELFGHSGYSADIYAGVLGTDTWVTPKTLVGAAITMGTADGEGEGATMRIDNDAKFYGAFAYTSHTPAENVTLSADIGFMNVENDITTDVNFGGEGDTKVITVGGRVDMTMYRSNRMTVTPHFGLRYANFSIDSMNQTATNDINVLEAPMGVTVKGKTQVKGWNVTPNVDFTLVPQFGDKKAKIWNSGAAFKQDVLDPALVNTSIGITGQKGNTTFGVNYRFGVGGDERQNHSFMGNIRYQF